jgi:thymidylate synthase
MSINQDYIECIREIRNTHMTASPRAMPAYELFQHTFMVDMAHPIITIPQRELDYKFMAAEAYWILRGLNCLDRHVRKNLVKYSDDGHNMFGAYGPPFVAQRDYVVQCLADDHHTRQAVVSLWHTSPRPSKDIPCTCGMQWQIRGGHLHCNVWMRSSDVWLGLPYDMFTFTMMTASIAILLKDHGMSVKLGTLHITAGNRHLYDRDWSNSTHLINEWRDGINLTIGLDSFRTVADLMIALDALRNIQDINKWKENWLCR